LGKLDDDLPINLVMGTDIDRDNRFILDNELYGNSVLHIYGDRVQHFKPA
jgi:hypothetical protein